MFQNIIKLPLISLILGYYNNFITTFISSLCISLYSLYIYKKTFELKIDFNVSSFVTFYVVGITLRNIDIISVLGGLFIGYVLSFITTVNKQDQIIYLISNYQLQILIYIKKYSIYIMMYFCQLFSIKEQQENKQEKEGQETEKIINLESDDSTTS
jgi:hypothetical protein